MRWQKLSTSQSDNSHGNAPADLQDVKIENHGIKNSGNRFRESKLQGEF